MERKTPVGMTAPTTGGSTPMIDDFIIRQISRAELLVGSGQIEEAISTLNEVLKLNPDSTHAHMKLKDVYLRAGMKPQAAEECLQLARIYESQGERTSASDYLVRARFLSPATGNLPSKPRPIQALPNDRSALPPNGSNRSNGSNGSNSNGSTVVTRLPQSEAKPRSDSVRLTGGPQQTATTVRSVPPNEAQRVADVVAAPVKPSPLAPPTSVPAPRSSASDLTIPELSVEPGTRFLKTDLAEIRRAVLGEDLSAGSALDLDLERLPQQEIDPELEPADPRPTFVSTPAPAVYEEAPIRIAAVPASTLVTAPLEKRGHSRRWLYRTAVAVVLLAGTAVAGGFWFNSRLDRQYAILHREYEAAAYASSYALAQADIVEVVTPDDSATVSQTEEAQPAPEETQRTKAEQDLVDRRTAERQQAQAARLAEPQLPTVAAAKPEARKASPLPPLTSQVPVIGAQSIADNRATAVLMNAGAAMGPPEPPPPAPTPAPARKQVVSAEAISKAQPSYPRSAVTAHVSGSVAVLVTISEQGSVTEARAISGPSLLWGAAVDAARRWKFRPSTIGGAPTKTSKTIVFNFKYDKNEK